MKDRQCGLRKGQILEAKLLGASGDDERHTMWSGKRLDLGERTVKSSNRGGIFVKRPESV